ncbi:hypothetical protein J6I75_08650 [Pseudidiomarina sp. 1APP75-27a]|uniref:hypothetical protein n=1 Tax=Pseudidiomarina terrestris TaxID=2820060 RepID=UPI002B05BDAD|nr:hypothetical protein [Pseudidiomarina sp. 1APP75-27a]MEA3588420.1 hypothetical protein [Pseudidiomarina sp. 1APP75-27a]
MSDKKNSNKHTTPTSPATSRGPDTSREQLRRRSINENFSDSENGALSIVQHFSPPSRRDNKGNTNKK